VSNEIRIEYSRLCQKISQRLQQAGLSATHADIEAEIMAEADLLSVPSHGVRMLPNLLRALVDGRVASSPHEKIIREFGAISVVDYGKGPGRYASHMAMNRAVQQATEFGVGICLAKNTSHWGRGHAYAYRAAKQGCIGLCTTNAIPSMAAWGARTKVIGNNPLAIGVPGKSREKPIVLDMAMSQAAVGKVATMLREGIPITEHLGFDTNGQPSVDPKAILAGAVAPMGAHKGESLALMMEMLTGALAGAAFGYQLLADDNSGVDAGSTKIFIAINLGSFIDQEIFFEKTTQLFSHLENATEKFQFPGERGWQAMEKNLREGVPIHIDIVKDLTQVGVVL
jgi:LDH2 family malate/lactate/ureidoglycolate dehydrogenase